MMNKEAFTYCWTDYGTNKLYIGYHKGSDETKKRMDEARRKYWEKKKGLDNDN